MPVSPPIKPEDANDGVQKTYNRIKETFGEGEVPTGFQMMAQCEPLLADSYMNYRKFVVDGDGLLDDKQRKAIALATVSAMNCVHCVRSHSKEAVAKGIMNEQEVQDVLGVTATCAMYNTYYKFKDMAGDDKFEAMTPGLRAHAFQRTTLDDATVELINIVVSNINGCLKCTSGHVAKSLQLGLTHEQIDSAMKISATMSAIATFHRTQ